jgi:dolichol-phosphate mannosyltransferase
VPSETGDVSRSSVSVLLALAQAWAGLRVIQRLLRTAGGERIRSHGGTIPGERISVIVPVLNERHRLGPCLASLMAQASEVAEILVVDGGSTDGTPALVADHCARDRRVRLLDATPVPLERNGKAHGLQVGLTQADPGSGWLLTVDADVRLAPGAARSMLAHAIRTDVAALSVATRQRLSGAAEGLLHPALLTTLVYRFGIPGRTARQVAEVQANGQCFLVRRAALERVGGFRVGMGSVCEDVTLARALVAEGYPVSFAESDVVVEATMYEDWRAAWRNWTRSLPMRDRFSGGAGWLGLVEVTLAQSLPLGIVLLGRHASPPRTVMLVNYGLLMVRLGVLLGAARAYPRRPWTYWLSPLFDLPVAVQLWRSALRRRHVWRGRSLVRDDFRTVL